MNITVTRHVQIGEKAVSTTATCDVDLSNGLNEWTNLRAMEITRMVRAVKDGIHPESDD